MFYGVVLCLFFQIFTFSYVVHGLVDRGGEELDGVGADVLVGNPNVCANSNGFLGVISFNGTG